MSHYFHLNRNYHLRNTNKDRSPEDSLHMFHNQHKPRYRKLLVEQGVLTETQADEAETGVLEELGDAVEFARQSPLPEPQSALEDLWA